MKPITIYPLNEGVINILKDLEKINLLKIEKTKSKVSEILKGSISHETAEEIRKQRQEWERNT